MKSQSNKRGGPFRCSQESGSHNKQQKEMQMKIKSRKSGFTLVELMVVAVIVAILAAVAIPMMTANKKRAMATEAESALGMLRSSLRTLYAETGAYNLDRAGNTIAASSTAGSVTNIPGVSTNDLSGRWFDFNAYTLETVAANTYCLRVKGSASLAPNHADVAGMTCDLIQDGSFTNRNY